MPLFKIRFSAMGGSCELNLAAAHEAEAQRLAQPAMAEVQRIEQKYSRFRPESVIGQINQKAGSGEWIECDEETLALLGFADKLYRDSGGLFDITSGVLRRAWNFNTPILPRPELLKELCALIDWQRVERDGKRVRLPVCGMELDFGGFGKEYATDRAASELARLGVRSGLVNLGGDLKVIGPQPDGTPWLVGIQNPRDTQMMAASIPLNHGALATSGDYERYFEVDGKRYCHLLDPRTGYPVNHWRSISVIASEAIIAGSYSTIAMLLQDTSLEFLKKSKLSFLGIDQNGDFHRQ